MTAPFVCPDDHKHAVNGTCYAIHKCRCDGCRAAMTARAGARSRAQLYGRWIDPHVPAEPVREHIEMLQAYGLGWKRIAALTGVGNTAVSQLIYGRNGSNSDPRKGEVLKRTTRVKADAILAVKPDLSLLAAGAIIPSRGTHRRLQSLVSIGWSQSKLAAQLNINRSNFGTMMGRASVLVGLHREVEVLFERLWNTEPAHDEWRSLSSFNRAKRYAAARRWLPPMAWDDIDTDVAPPIAEAGTSNDGVDEAAVELAMSGEDVRLTSLERRAAVTRLHAQRLSDHLIADRLRINARTVLRIRQELVLAAFDQDELIFRDAA
ncbi:hypothetical protein E3T26_04780 [Cryobacterium sp. TMT1-21]|uniref:hypothetical protein n=1 Tax=Cryobacterium sp. TMT1-21 TaxID=1259234 RepID=UPI00106C7958|nr:hypothetical protein [Cryobacterium sp. TMT1-21]TFD16200.1 hypothetical protein E3T26_04780 [Cryobacterium sp. TMT1-21]